ncbi:hypothetical protein F3Y22_tig00109923pilonHSYRG00018 [Hibiscus syriacus]|uniref:RNase H type-1 domain-containing protein n=1 Tax=Hibiscus syriacus TaxID=106335 RepID=A0A6A3BSZ9_HIBSY|nr:hypothetical protein F3Y22_tig00109923pilonHSYRG00018 [Hibiscus syriacus]
MRHPQGRFFRNIGRCSAFHAEIWAILDGLKLASECDVRCIEVEVHNSEAVRILNTSSQSHDATNIRRIRELLKLNWKVNIVYGSREVNNVANSPAQSGRSYSLGLTILRQPPDGFQRLLYRHMTIGEAEVSTA